MLPIQRKVGAAVRRLRKAKGWTQEQLAIRTGLHRAHVGAIERGERNVTLETMQSLAKALRVNVKDLLEG